MECEVGRKPTDLGEVFSALNDVLIAFYILWFIKRFGLALVAFMVIGATNSRATIGGIGEDCLPRFTGGTGYDKVPLERLTVG